LERGAVTARSVTEMDEVLGRLQQQSRSGGSPNPLPGSSSRSVQPAGSPRLFSHAPTYFPGTAIFANATRVEVAAGDERTGLDFVTTSVPVTTLEGTTISLDGPLPASLELNADSGNSLTLI